MADRSEEQVRMRTAMVVIGMLAGVAVWAIAEFASRSPDHPHLFITLAAAVAGFFGVLLVLFGPLSPGRALVGAATVALPAAVLVGWASFRHETLETFLGGPFPILTWLVILFVGTPFVSVRLKPGTDWLDYPSLFTTAWNICVRYAASWLFVGALFLVLLLSDALLQLVGLDVIENLFEIDVVPHLLTGAALGLGLAIAYELRDYISPFLLLRLLRLLVPVMLVVVVVFVVAFVLRGPAALFDGLSPAATLMSVALGCIALISIALDVTDRDAVQGRLMLNATRGLALILPVLAGLALWALRLRIGQYGWTPDRLAATVSAGFVTAYALAYFVAVLRATGWQVRIRQSNIRIALAVIAVAALWLSPALNAERISTNSQVARYLEGRAAADEVAVWEMRMDWGHAGQAGLARLEALEGEEHADLKGIIKAAREIDSRYAFDRDVNVKTAVERAKRLRAMIRVMPDEAQLDPVALVGLPAFRLDDWLAACATDQAPGCVLVLGDFDASMTEQQGVLFLPGALEAFDALSVRLQGGSLIAMDLVSDTRDGTPLRLSGEQVSGILAGNYRIAPSSRRSLWVGETEIFP